MECNLGWNHLRDFKIERACSASSIWNHKYDFRPKLHDTRFNYHFITSILKFSNEGLGQFKYFIDAVQSRFENSSIFGGESESFGNISCKIFSAIWSVTLNKPWNLIGCFDFSVASSLAGKKMQFKAKNGAIRESIVEKRWKWECLRGKKSEILQPTA